MVRIRDMLAAFAAVGLLMLLGSCGVEPREPTACERERAEVTATENAVDYPTYFHTLVEDHTKYFKPVCVHGIPYFMETDQSYLDKRGNDQSLVPVGKPYYDYSAWFWNACKKLEKAKKPAPKGVVDPQG